MTPPPSPALPLALVATLALLGGWLSARAARCGEWATRLAAAPRAAVRVGEEEALGAEALAAGDGALTLRQWAAREGYSFELRRCPRLWGAPSLWLTRAGEAPRALAPRAALRP